MSGAVKVEELPSGFIEDLPAEAYHGGPGISKTGLTKVLKSPAHYQVFKAKPLDTAALRFGRLFHTMVLEPHKLDAEYVIALDLPRRSKADKEAHAEFEEAHAGKVIVKQDDWDLSVAMAEAVRQHDMGKVLLEPDDCIFECSAFWADTHTGQLVRARPDAYNTAHELVIDLKSAADASASGFSRACGNLRYYLSDHMTRTGMAAVDRPIQDFIFLAVEKKPPYAIGVHRLDDEVKRRAAEVYERAITTYDRCMKAEHWPGYPPAIQTLSLPPRAYD